MSLSIAVLNFSGNVGKTTIARHLLAPRIPGAELVSVESINADGDEQLSILGRDFGHLQGFVNSGGSVVVDIGASNIEVFLKMMEKFQGSQEDFDYFIVPTTPAAKQQKDTIATLLELSKQGIEPARIKVLFNMVESSDRIADEFSMVLAFLEKEKIASTAPDCFITANEVFQLSRDGDGNVAQLKSLAEDTDTKMLKAQIASTEDAVEKQRLTDRLGATRLARGMLPQLDACFAALQLQ